MNTPRKLKRTLGFALAATTASLMSAASADVVLGDKTAIDGGWTRTITSGDAGTEIVVAYTNTAAAGYTFTVPEGVTAIDYLVVGGGGGGSDSNNGGGGGAGGVLTNTAPYAVVPASTLSVKVGAGGSVTHYASGGNGGNSSLDDLVAIGGGGGGKADSDGSAGGSGGGAGGGGGVAKVGGAGTEGQGYAGAGHVRQKCGAGGGGAGGTPANPTQGYSSGSPDGHGGPGIVCDITGESVGYAAGGAGGGESGTTCASGGSAGGVVIGGNGGFKTSYGLPGTDGTGSGGGGNGKSSQDSVGRGGSGIVVLRYTGVVKATFTYDESKCGVTLNGTAIDADTKVAYAALNSVATVTVTPNSVYEYTSAPEGWTLEASGSISRTYTSSETAAAMSITIPDPEKKAVETVAVTFTEAVHATKVATIDDVEIGAEVVKGSTVVVTATPETHYEYAEVPTGWEAASGAIIYTFTASEATAITIPEPTLIMVPVTVTGLDNTSSVITTNEVEITSGTLVPEGTEFVITVTPQGIYEYTAAPEGWTKNNDGTITYSATTEKGMAAIQVPSENLAKQQVTLGFTSRGVSYVASNVWDISNITAVKHGDKVNVDARIEVRATAFPSYTLTNDLGSAWTKDGETIVGTFDAGAITIPTATWTPTDGELIENGGFEYFDYGVGYAAVGGSFPASFVGGWAGKLTTSSSTPSLENSFGIWKNGDAVSLQNRSFGVNGQVHSGTYAGGAVGCGTASWTPTHIQVPFTTPATAGTSASYRLSYWRKNLKANVAASSVVVTIRDAEGAQVGETIESTKPLTQTWTQTTAEITGLARSTQYYLRFDVGLDDDSNFAVDDISLKQLPPKGLIILIK